MHVCMYRQTWQTEEERYRERRCHPGRCVCHAARCCHYAATMPWISWITLNTVSCRIVQESERPRERARRREATTSGGAHRTGKERRVEGSLRWQPTGQRTDRRLHTMRDMSYCGRRMAARQMSRDLASSPHRTPPSPIERQLRSRCARRDIDAEDFDPAT